MGSLHQPGVLLVVQRQGRRQHRIATIARDRETLGSGDWGLLSRVLD